MPDTPAPFVIVGMMALFGGVAKAPIAVILMVAEMTNEFSMIVPAMLATTVAYLVTGETRMYESQVNTRSDSPAHRGEYVIPLIKLVNVGDAMRTSIATLAAGTPIAVAEKQMAEHRSKGFPVMDGDRLIGIFTVSDAVRADREGLKTVGEAMTSDLTVAVPADSVHEALSRMSRAQVSRLPVVSPADDQRLLGIIDASDIASALDKQLVRLDGPDRSEALAALNAR
jgi:CIC family chloride channel protein